MACDVTAPVLLPEKFDGNQNFDDWVSHFECVSKINEWNDDQKALWLRARVTGKAHVAYNRFSHEIQDSYNLMQAALRERFEPSSKKNLYKAQLDNRTKRREEGWADFGDDLCSLVDKAYPEFNHEAREQLALFHFFNQLQHPQILLPTQA